MSATIEQYEQSLTCERCGRTDRWLGSQLEMTFPDGWSVVFPRWRELGGDDGPIFQDPEWVCDACLRPSDDEGASWVLPVSSDADAPPVVVLVEAQP